MCIQGKFRTPWTPAEEAELAHFIKTGPVPYASLAAYFGRTHNAIVGKVNELRQRGVLPREEAIPGATITDDDHVALCVKQGGFPAYTDTRNPRHALGVVLPLIYAAR